MEDELELQRIKKEILEKEVNWLIKQDFIDFCGGILEFRISYMVCKIRNLIFLMFLVWNRYLSIDL